MRNGLKSAAVPLPKLRMGRGNMADVAMRSGGPLVAWPGSRDCLAIP